MSTLMMPKCGLSFADVSLAALECRGNRVRTARRLGVGIRSLDAAVDRNPECRWWFNPRGGVRRPRATCISRQDIIVVAADGVVMRDAAYILGVSYDYLKQLVARWELLGFFPHPNESRRIARIGYVPK